MSDMNNSKDTLDINLTINNEEYSITIEKKWTLLYVLREVLDLTGTKAGCRTGDCGSPGFLRPAGAVAQNCRETEYRYGGYPVEKSGTP